MPTYEYRCTKCDKTFEHTARIEEQDHQRPPCPACTSEDVERVFSAFFAKTSRKS